MAQNTSPSTVVKHLYDGAITLIDGTGTPLTCTARFSVGDLTVSGLKAKLRDTTAYQARGVVTSIRHGARNFPSLSFSMQLAEFSETTTGTVIDFITARSGTPYASRVSTRGSSAEVFTCDVKIAVEGTSHGDTQDGTFTAEDVELSFDPAEGEPNTLTLNGTVYGAISGDIVIAVT